MKMSMKDPRYKMPKQTRRFGGITYSLLYVGNKADVKRLRNTRTPGLPPMHVRTTKYKGQLAIYTRRGGK